MSDLPVDRTVYDAVLVPVETVEVGCRLLLPRGEGAALFVVDAVSSHEEDDGTTTYTLVSTPTVDNGEPWVEQIPGGDGVHLVEGASKYQLDE